MPGIITTTGERTADRILLLLSRLPITEKVYTKIMHTAKTGRPCAILGFAYVLFVYRKRGSQDSGLFLICNVPGNTNKKTKKLFRERGKEWEKKRATDHFLQTCQGYFLNNTRTGNIRECIIPMKLTSQCWRKLNQTRKVKSNPVDRDERNEKI